MQRLWKTKSFRGPADPLGGADALAVIVVTHDSAHHLRALMSALLPQLRPEDEVLVVDNNSRDATAKTAKAVSERIRVIETGSNVGFAGGCAAGARASDAPLLLFLNPDCEPHPRCLTNLREAAFSRPGWGAWQCAVLLPDGRINTDGGVVHFLGLGWAGNCLKPRGRLPTVPTEVAFPSGAAMVVRRQVWDSVGGLDPSYFMYGEDLDLGLRLWLNGHGVGVVPAARVTHSYEFDKGANKWFWLERNRWRTVLSVYPARLLLILLPALLASDLLLLGVAAKDGWLVAKLRAQWAVVKGLRGTCRRRKSVQALRRADDLEFARHLTASLDSPFLSISPTSALARAQRMYWRSATWILRGLAR